MEQVDVEALQAVARDRRSVTASVAEHVGVPEAQTRQRLEQLMASGHLAGPHSSSVDHEEFGWWLTPLGRGVLADLGPQDATQPGDGSEP